MLSVRKVLNRLDAAALRRLVDARGLERARGLRGLRARLSRSYRGDMERLLEELLRKELVRVFEREIRTENGSVWLPGPGRYSHEDLRLFARSIFLRGRIPAEFELQPFEEGDVEADRDDTGADDEDAHEDAGDIEDDESEAVGDGSDDPGGEDEREDDATDAGDADDAGTGRVPFVAIDTSWSRPLKLSRVLQRAGLPVPERLRTERFGGLLERLDELGLEARPEEGDAPFDASSPSPGIGARVRLRRRGTAAAPAPRAVIEPRLVPATSPPRATQRLADWELALARLELLTAVPSATREHNAEWPGGFIQAAARGLSLGDFRLRHLATISAGLLRGTHDPFPPVQRLAGCLEPHEWEALFRDLGRLNPAGEEVASLEREIRLVARLPGAPSSLRANEVSSGPRTEAPVPKAAAPPAAGSASVNDRSLGELDKMFD